MHHGFLQEIHQHPYSVNHDVKMTQRIYAQNRNSVELTLKCAKIFWNLRFQLICWTVIESCGSRCFRVFLFSISHTYTTWNFFYLFHLNRQPERDQIVIATKLRGMTDGARNFSGQNTFFPNRCGLSRQAIMKNVEDSLRRLLTHYIDLYQVIQALR